MAALQHATVAHLLHGHRLRPRAELQARHPAARVRPQPLPRLVRGATRHPVRLPTYPVGGDPVQAAAEPHVPAHSGVRPAGDQYPSHAGRSVHILA